MITNINLVITQISRHIKDTLKSAAKNGVVIGVSGGLNSSLLAALCYDEGIPVFCFHYVCNDDIAASCANTLPAKISAIYHKSTEKEYGGGSSAEVFRASQIQAHLNTLASEKNYLIASSICRTKLNLVRRYIKHTESADIHPFCPLYRSELDQIAKPLIGIQSSIPARGISEIHPDLIPHEERLALSFAEIEWADRENDKNKILDQNPLNEYPYWYKYFLRQKEVLSRIQQIESRTRHKDLIVSAYRGHIKGLT